MPNPFTQFRNRATLSAQDAQKQERSWAELKAGRLPLSAQERLAAETESAAFTSDLTSRELTALRAGGYEPVGQAFGTSTVSYTRQVYQNYQIHPAAYGLPATTMGRPFGSMTSGSLRVDPKTISGYYDGQRSSQSRALRRVVAEALGLGADGVLGLRIVRSRPADGLSEFTLIGTAVRRAQRTEPSPAPFTTTLSAAEVAQLAQAGWRPVQLLFELQRYGGHGGYLGFGGGRLNPRNYEAAEVPAATAVLEFGRSSVRQALNRQLPAGGGMILSRLHTDQRHQECTAIDGQSDFVVDVEAIGTSIEPIPSYRVRSGRPPLDIMPVMPLNDRGDGS
jgi:uncharacterized protein YbjQ (UPF0145 family)